MKTEKIYKYLPFVAAILSLLIYLTTVSRNVNFWDSGELIACADGLQISHPPGSPLYLILGRIFIILSFGVISKAFALNILSSISAAAAVFFTYKITYVVINQILSKYYSKTINENNIKILSALGSLTSSLAMAFSKSFWSVAVVTEIYALSLFFTSFTFWLIVKFYFSNKNDSYNNRLIILISFILGISIGVHQLNILIVPVWVLALWMKKQNLSKIETILMILIAIISVVGVQYLITVTLYLASSFELLFVNTFSLPYYSGVIFFVILLLLGLVLGIYFSGKNRKPVLNLLFTSALLFYIGFSIYFVIPIRSASNPTIDQNNPETIFSFINYYEREQYGNRPLWYGQQFNSSLDKIKPYLPGNPVWDTVNGKYKIITFKPKANYEKRDCRFFPRMWSNLPQHVAAYREWTKYYSEKVPGFDVNLKFLFRYQLSHMYFRYFMWNFAGKQNDYQSHGGPVFGNWISGFSFFDNFRLSDDDDIPSKLADNPANDAYYLLPLLLGIFGFVKLYRNDKRQSLMIIILFIMTGIAINFYLNQHPYQVRERDYSYLGSFFSFCILIGLSVPFLYVYTKKWINSTKRIILFGSLIFVAVPGQFLIKNYDDSDRSNDNIAYEFAYNMLNSCDENAILFVSGDNETFSLWYLQNCVGVRRDVNVINISYLNTDWYIDQIRTNRSNAKPILTHLSKNQYISGQRELLLVKNNPFAFIEDIYIENLKEINDDFSQIIKYFDNILLKSNFHKTRPEEYRNFKEIYSKAQPHGANADFVELTKIIRSLNSEERCADFDIPFDQAKELNRLFEIFLQKQTSYPIPLNACMNFVFSDDKATKIETRLYDYPIDYFPANKLSLNVNKIQIEKLSKSSGISEKYFVHKMIWNLDYESITKGELMIYEIILSNMWERPIYFSSLLNSRNFMGLQKYLFLEGLAYRLLPVETEISVSDPVNVNAVKMYNKLKKKFIFDNLKNGENFDENTRNILINFRNHFSRLARGLYFSGEIKKSEEILDLIVELLPDEKIPFDYYMNGIIHGYYRINKYDKASVIGKKTLKNAYDELTFYCIFPPEKQFSIEAYKKQAFKTIEEIYLMSKTYNDKNLFEYSVRYYTMAQKLLKKS